MSGRIIPKSSVQSNFSVDITPTYAIPFGDLKDIYNNGYGGLITINQKLKSSAIIFIEGGYVSFKGKPINISIKNLPKYSITPPSLVHIPINFGVKYYEENFYYGVGVGVGMTKLEGSDIQPTTKLMLNPMVGYDFGPLMIGINYSVTTTETSANKYLGLRLTLKLSKLDESVNKN